MFDWLQACFASLAGKHPEHAKLMAAAPFVIMGTHYAVVVYGYMQLARQLFFRPAVEPTSNPDKVTMPRQRLRDGSWVEARVTAEGDVTHWVPAIDISQGPRIVRGMQKGNG